jgi:hypothetical protein
MPLGLPFATRSEGEFRAIGTASPTVPAEMAVTMLGSSATKTSAGAPSLTCRASVEDPANVKFATTLARGFSFSKA